MFQGTRWAAPDANRLSPLCSYRLTAAAIIYGPEDHLRGTPVAIVRRNLYLWHHAMLDPIFAPLSDLCLTCDLYGALKDAKHCANPCLKPCRYCAGDSTSPSRGLTMSSRLAKCTWIRTRSCMSSKTIVWNTQPHSGTVTVDHLRILSMASNLVSSTPSLMMYHFVKSESACRRRPSQYLQEEKKSVMSVVTLVKYSLSRDLIAVSWS